MVTTVSAANPKSDFSQGASSGKGSRLRTEWGLTAAAYYNTMTLDSSASGITVAPRFGYGAGLHMALKIGNFFAIQPEINYQRANISVQTDASSKSVKVKTNTLDVPVLLSLRFANILRINAGPLFTLMNNCHYTDAAGEKQLFGNTRPTFGYSAGVAVVLLRRYMIDARYTGYFKSSLFNLDGREFGGKTQTVSLKIGFLF